MALVGAAAIVFGWLRPKTDAERFATMGDDVREAVLRNLAREVLKDEVVYLTFDGGRDAPDTFLARVADLPCRLRQGSAGERVLRRNGRILPGVTVYDRVTGERGTGMTVEFVRWISDVEVDVSVQVYSNPRLRGHSIYKVRRVGGRWRFISREPALLL
jgi:hypothetical protein